MLVAHGGVYHLADGEFPHIAGERVLQQRLGIGAGHLELAERREVHDGGALAAGPIFGDRPVIGELRQPIAAIFGVIARQRRETRMERSLARELGFGVWRHPVGHSSGEALFAGIGAHMDVGRVPSIGRIDVVRASRRDADEIGERAQQNIVAWARPRLVEIEHVIGVDAGVVEEVERHPPFARGDAVRRELLVEIVRAIDMAGITLVVIIARVAGKPEGVVAADSVAHLLHQRLHVLIEALERRPGCG